MFVMKRGVIFILISLFAINMHSQSLRGLKVISEEMDDFISFVRYVNKGYKGYKLVSKNEKNTYNYEKTPVRSVLDVRPYSVPNAEHSNEILRSKSEHIDMTAGLIFPSDILRSQRESENIKREVQTAIVINPRPIKISKISLFDLDDIKIQGIAAIDKE